MKNSLITKWSALIVATIAFIGGIIGVSLATRQLNQYFATLTWSLFVIGLVFALALSLALLPRFTHGAMLHFLRALLMIICFGPVIVGPEGTWVPVAFVLFLVSASHRIEPLYYFVASPINIIAPLAVFVTGFFASIFWEMHKSEKISINADEVAGG